MRFHPFRVRLTNGRSFIMSALSRSSAELRAILLYGPGVASVSRLKD